jgi:monoamine oxidase
MAGLTAARALLERGLSVCVLESRNSVGGRILTRTIDGNAIELGAEFVHGRPPELWSLIAEAGLSTYELGGTHVNIRSSGQQEEQTEDFSILEDLEDFTGEDCAFSQYLDQIGVAGKVRERVFGFVEGFNAADANIISVRSLGVQQKAEDAIEGDRLWRIREGYARLPEYLAAKIGDLGGHIRLHWPVSEILWQPGQVQLRGPGSLLVRALKVVVSVPLAVLQAGAIDFSPSPGDRLELLAGMRMGQACRFTLRFRERFWKQLPGFQDLSFLYTSGETPSVWWTTQPEATADLTGWVGGPRSDALAGRTAEQLAEQACLTLAKSLGIDLERVRDLLLSCMTGAAIPTLVAHIAIFPPEACIFPASSESPSTIRSISPGSIPILRVTGARFTQPCAADCE